MKHKQYQEKKLGTNSAQHEHPGLASKNIVAPLSWPDQAQLSDISYNAELVPDQEPQRLKLRCISQTDDQQKEGNEWCEG